MSPRRREHPACRSPDRQSTAISKHCQEPDPVSTEVSSTCHSTQSSPSRFLLGSTAKSPPPSCPIEIARTRTVHSDACAALDEPRDSGHARLARSQGAAVTVNGPLSASITRPFAKYALAT